MTLRQIRAKAKELGATIDLTCGEVNVEAPRGKVWRADGVHELVNSPWFDQTRTELLEYALERMLEGLDECPDLPNCEWCTCERTG